MYLTDYGHYQTSFHNPPLSSYGCHAGLNIFTKVTKMMRSNCRFDHTPWLLRLLLF